MSQAAYGTQKVGNMKPGIVQAGRNLPNVCHAGDIEYRHTAAGVVLH